MWIDIWIPSAGAHTLEASVGGAVSTRPNAGIHVVDSSPGHGLRKRLPSSIDVIPFPNRPFNFAHFVNLALQTSKADVVTIWNDDIERPSPQMLQVFGKHINEGHTAVGCLLLHPGSNAISHAGIYFGRNSFPDHIGRGADPRRFGPARQCRDTLAVTGAVMAMRRGEAIRLGGWDEGYPNGYEDIDFCLRARFHGQHVAYCGEVLAYHHESLTRGHNLPAANRRAQIVKWRSIWNLNKIRALAFKARDPYVRRGW